MKTPLTAPEKERFAAYLEELGAEHAPKVHHHHQAGDAEASREARDLHRACVKIIGILRA